MKPNSKIINHYIVYNISKNQLNPTIKLLKINIKLNCLENDDLL